MFNPYQFTYQPYFLMPDYSHSLSPFPFHDNTSFFAPQFIPFSFAQNGHTATPTPIPQCVKPLDSIPSSNKDQSGPQNLKAQQSTLNKHIIKEKIIKKPANRPATYLTQRKYYLAQALQEESNSNRKLRPRNLKKRNHKHHEKAISQEQEPLNETHKNIVREENGFSELSQQSQKRNSSGLEKTQQRETLLPVKSSRNLDSLLSDETNKCQKQ